MKLTRDMMQLLLMTTSATIIFVYNAIFVNLYIWEKSHSIFDVAWYHVWMFLAGSSAYMYATKHLLSRGIRSLLRVSAVFGAFSFLILSSFHVKEPLINIVFYAVPIGITLGTYWGGMNIMITLLGKGKEFKGFFSALAIITQLVSISVPLLSAFVINQIGYVGSFLLMLVFVIMMFVFSFFIPNTSLKNGEDVVFSLSHLIRMRNYSHSKFSSLLCTSFFHGLIMQFQALFVLLFTFRVTENEWWIAALNILYTLASIIASVWFKRNQRFSETKWVLIGMVSLSSGILFSLSSNSFLLIVSNLLTTFGLFYINTVIFANQFSLMSKEEPMIRVSFLAWREIMYLSARMLLLGIVMLVEWYPAIIYVLMGLTIIIGFHLPFVLRNSELKRTIISKTQI
jgi:MFS transporter, YQGE family, putative transporter